MPAFFQKNTFQDAIVQAKSALDDAATVAGEDWRNTRFQHYINEFASVVTSGDTSRIWESASQLFQIELSRPIWSQDPHAPTLLKQVFRGEPSWAIDPAGQDTTSNDDPGRNFLLELALAGQYAASGGKVALSAPGAKGDIHLTTTDGRLMVVECKRPMWKASLKRNLVKARNQLGATNADYRVIALGVDRLVAEDSWPVDFAAETEPTETFLSKGVYAYHKLVSQVFQDVGPPVPSEVAAVVYFLAATVRCEHKGTPAPFALVTSVTCLNGPNPYLQSELERLSRQVRLP